MQNRSTFLLGLAAAALLVMGGVPGAWAGADISQTVQVAEDDGFPGLCVAPCFVVEKTVEVWFPTNTDPNKPTFCGSGEYTYVYTLTHLGNPPSTLPAPGIPVTEFELSVDDALIAAAGWDGALLPPPPGPPGTVDVDPLSVTVSALDVVNWGFPGTPSCPDCLDQLQTSAPLWLCSTAAPGTAPDELGGVSITAILLDAPGECIVPVRVDGDPRPCTIGFWKNHDDRPPYDTLADHAADLDGSAGGGLFPTGADLLTALNRKGGHMTMTEKALRQLAATLLNLAAGDLLDDETAKCQLFEGNQIDDNSCGTAPLSIGEAVSQSIAKIEGPFQVEMAKDCVDEINNRIGVVDATTSE
jgi:hypothetical protein